MVTSIVLEAMPFDFSTAPGVKGPSGFSTPEGNKSFPFWFLALAKGTYAVNLAYVCVCVCVCGHVKVLQPGT